MQILVMDGQGGKMGREIISGLRERIPAARLAAVGTNSAATAAMLKGGADYGATGENAVVVACRTADVIVGPIGIVIADALFGEITPVMAVAVAQSRAVRVLIPVNRCENVIAGVCQAPMSEYIRDAIERVSAIFETKAP